MDDSTPSGHCPSCGQETPDGAAYCPACGEKQSDHRRPLKHLLAEFIEHSLHLDSKSWHTLKMLFLKPGQLPRDFNKGKRHAYVAPVRLYIFMSFVFFLIIPISPLKKHSAQPGQQEGRRSVIVFTFKNLNSDELIGLNERQIDDLIAAKGIKANSLNRRIIHSAARYASAGKNMWDEFIHKWIKGLSYSMFLLMPWFALLTFLFFQKARLFFVEHLVFSLYFHSFFLALFTLAKVAIILRARLFLKSIFLLAILVLTGVYLYFALRRMFGQGRGKTIWKTAVIWLLHIAAVTLSAVTVVGLIFFFF